MRPPSTIELRALIAATLVTLVVAAAVALPGKPAAQESTADLRQVTKDPAADYYPSWAPDGASIAFGSERRGYNIWVVNLDGGAPRQLTHAAEGDSSWHPSWSPAGPYIAHDARVGASVRVVSSEDGTLLWEMPEYVPISRGGHPCWSRDGSKLAFTSEGSIWTVDFSSGTLTEVFSREGFWARAFGWSPDDTRLAIDLSHEGTQEADVWIVSLDGREALQITDYPGREANPNWSPDGSMIAFMSEHGGNRDIWLIPAAGGEATQVTFDPGADRNPRWSPDGKRLAFASERGGNMDIWILDLEELSEEAGRWPAVARRYEEPR